MDVHPYIRECLVRFHTAFAAARKKRAVRIGFRVCVGLALLPLLFAVCTDLYVNFYRGNLPDLSAFIRFEPPTMGRVYDANGQVLIELGRERRDILRYEEIPDVVRNAVLAAEDKNFFSHSGVDYSVMFRLVAKTNLRAMGSHFTPFSGEGADRPNVFPQGGSTLTQQLVRGYFLRQLTSTRNSNTLQHAGFFPKMLAFFVGEPGANKFLLKIEATRLSLWIEKEMQKQYGTKLRAKQEIFARYASFVYMGNGRYGFAAASEYYFHKRIQALTLDDADKAALLAGVTKSPGEYAPTLGNAQKTTRRRNQILHLMVANRFLSAEAAQRLASAPIHFVVRRIVEPVEAPTAVQATLDELKRVAPGLGSGVGIDRLFEGQIQVHSTVDLRIQRIANLALENGLQAYEKRHPQGKGTIQGSVVVLRNSDAAILAETGGREMYNGQRNTYGDYNRVTQSRRQPGSAMKPFVYLAAFRQGTLDLQTSVPDNPIAVIDADGQAVKWIANADNQFQGMIPARQALAASRNAAAIWIAEQVGIAAVVQAARDLGIRSEMRLYIATALGASEVTLLELANAYRRMAGGMAAEPYVISKIQQTRGEVVYRYDWPCCLANGHDSGLALIQEGLRGVVRIPGGTAHALDSHAIPVMGKTGTTNNYRDAMFVGSTYGPKGITVAVRLGFDNNRSLGVKETGARAALPVFREIMQRVYREKLAGPAPRFPAEMEETIDAYLRGELPLKDAIGYTNPFAAASLPPEGTEECVAKPSLLPAYPCDPSRKPRIGVYPIRNERGRLVFANQ